MKFFALPCARGLRLFLLLATLVVGLQACGGGGDASPGPGQLANANFPAPGVPEPTPAPANPTPAPAEATVTPVAPTPAPAEPTPVPADSTPAPAPGQTAGSLILLSPTSSCSIENFRNTVMQQVNAARASGRTCGAEALPPVSALAWNDILFSAAARHSLDMATRNYYSHVTPEGVDPAQRLSAEGYGWSAMGENIAAGYGSIDAVMAGWLASAAHCHALMQPAFADVALACVAQPGTDWGVYWSMELGRR